MFPDGKAAPKAFGSVSKSSDASKLLVVTMSVTKSHIFLNFGLQHIYGYQIEISSFSGIFE